MSYSFFRGVVLMALSASAGLAQAAPSTQPSASPLDPKATVPRLVYTSALAGYRRLADDAPIPWREANDTVTRIGGWRVYTREAREPTPKAP